MPGRPQPSDRPLRPQEITSFDVLWGTNCAGCHGADGTSGPARPMNDALYLAWIGEGNLRLILQQGVPVGLMPAFAIAHGGSLTDDQIEILIREMREHWGKAHPAVASDLPPYAAPIGDAARGAAVYQEFCARCHGADGTGGEARGSIVDPSYLALVSNQALRSAVVAGRVDLGMPDFRGLVPGTEMTDEQIADVVAWLVGHRVEFPGQPFAKKEKETHG
jgi:cytochrome c oxidase cbb3-type subunit 3/ubiquinol-cytochrome c reductase cytochrome c subunit